jgi:hypothetical protein
VTIKVFSSKFNDEPTEVHQSDAPTVGAWLVENIKSYKPHLTQQFSVAVNGERICQAAWHDRLVSTLDDIHITVEPKGTELFFGGLLLVATRMMTPKIPKLNSSATKTGKDLDQASAKGNKIKLNDIRPDVSGLNKIYPNVVKPPHRYFAGKRNQRVNLCLDVGKGYHSIQPNDIMIGDTSVLSLGDDVSWKLYQPGQSLAADTRAEWWHDVVEVGSGSNGASGLELALSDPLTEGYVASAHRLSNYVVTIPAGAGLFPADWTAGLIVRIEAPYQYEVINGSRDIIRGMALQMLAPVAGQSIEIDGATNSGVFLVNSYTPYAAEIPATPGVLSKLTGSAPPTRYDFDVTPITFTVKLGTTNYPLTINTATTNLAGLVTAINTAKASAPFVATGVGGVIVLTQTGTPDGKSLSVTSGSTIVGGSPTVVAGVAPTPLIPEVIPEMTLNLTDGSPAASLALGPMSASIGPSGLRYRLVTASTTNLTVSRLTSGGAADPSFPGFQFLESSAVVITLDPSNMVGGYRGPFAACPEGETTTRLEWDTFHPQGLCGVGREGQIYEVNAYHTLEYRDMATAGAWTAVDKEHRNGSLNSCGFTDFVDLPYPMRPEVRIIKRFVSQPGRTDKEKKDATVWYGMRSRLSGATVYPDSTTLVLSVRGGDRLSAQAEQLVWLKTTRMLPVRRGGVWLPREATRDIVPFCLYVLKSVGYVDSDLDLAEWDRLDAFWRARGDTYDKIHNSSSTVLQVIEDALAAGFAELTVKNGLITLVRDEPQTFYKALYTVDAMALGGELDIRFDTVKPDDYDGVDVEYMDGIKWQVATVKCRFAGAPAAKRVLKIKAEGITSKVKAYQFGMRRLREERYHRKTFTWGTHMDALNSNFMDYVQVAGDVPGYSQSTVMEAYKASTRTVTATEPLNWSDYTPPYFMSIRTQDGKCFGPVRVTPVGEYGAQLETPLDFTPILDNSESIMRPLILLGVGYSVQIRDIKPNGTDAATVDARIYAPEVYLDDDSLPPA